MRLRLSGNAQRVLEARYLRRGPDGDIIEMPEHLFRRVARSIAAAEGRFDDARAAGHWEELFFDALTRLDFLPNSPTLMNAGTPLGQLSACFVLPVEDSMEGIFDSLKLMALIQQSGGGTGFSFSHLRPRGTLSFPLAAHPPGRSRSCASSTVPPRTSGREANGAALTWACSGSIIRTSKSS